MLMIFILPISVNYFLFYISFVFLLFFLLFNFKFSYMFIFKNTLVYSDNISLGFVFLTIFIIIFLVLSITYLKSSVNFFYLLIFSTCLFFFLIFSFFSSSFFSFYIFFESSLIPIYLIIIGWGYQPERLFASFYLLLYTIFFSLPLIIFIFFLFRFKNSLNLVFL